MEKWQNRTLWIASVVALFIVAAILGMPNGARFFIKNRIKNVIADWRRG